MLYLFYELFSPHGAVPSLCHEQRVFMADDFFAPG
jgi:hypothetical protein